MLKDECLRRACPCGAAIGSQKRSSEFTSLPRPCLSARQAERKGKGGGNGSGTLLSGSQSWPRTDMPCGGLSKRQDANRSSAILVAANAAVGTRSTTRDGGVDTGRALNVHDPSARQPRRAARKPVQMLALVRYDDHALGQPIQARSPSRAPRARRTHTSPSCPARLSLRSTSALRCTSAPCGCRANRPWPRADLTLLYLNCVTLLTNIFEWRIGCGRRFGHVNRLLRMASPDYCNFADGGSAFKEKADGLGISGRLRPVQRCGATKGSAINISPRFNQYRYQSIISFHCRTMDRCESLLVPRIGICAMPQQQRHKLAVVTGHG